MGLKPGQTNNPKGRPPGVKNKINTDLRKMVGDFLAQRFSKIDEVFDQLTAREQARFLLELMAYGLPKYQTVEKSEDTKKESLNVYQLIEKQLIDEGYESNIPELEKK